MITLGYTLSSEEFDPQDLVEHAVRAERAGFEHAIVSDHFHPWIDRQGHSPFVWSTLGAVSQATSRIRVGTGVTCPLMRIHPAIVAQAAATAALQMPGRFFLSVGTGENLNEHITGERWPSPSERLEMLVEAIMVIRLLWSGGVQSHDGRYYTVDEARIYSLPDEPIPIMVAASGKNAAEVAGRLGDGLISTAPRREIVDAFRAAGGDGKPTYGQLTVCWANDAAEAKRISREHWPNTGLGGNLSTEIKSPEHFEAAVQAIREDDLEGNIVFGPDPATHLEEIRRFADAGFDHVYIHQIGPDQEGFFGFYEREILPKFRAERLRTAG